MTQEVAAIMASTTYRDAVAVLDRDHDRIVDDIIRLTEIPSPPFGEDVRGDAYLEMLRAHGLTDVEKDAIGNVMGLRRGIGNGPLVVVAASGHRVPGRHECDGAARRHQAVRPRYRR